ncbi:MAG TPA: hypothetical protein VEG30_10745 [Terriglobales bacterium]|nr:hypothetical protein [Terriglobales bacterium]
MRRRWEKFAILMAVVITSAPLIAQYVPWYEEQQPRWRLTGAIGFDFHHGSLDTETLGQSGNTTDTLFGGTVDATLSGHLFNPQFLNFTANVSDLQSGGTTSSSGPLPAYENRNGALSYGIYANILEGRGMPLLVHFVHTDSGIVSNLTHQNQGTQEYGFDWRPRLPHVRNIYLNYRDTDSNVAIPTSLYQTNNTQKVFQATANDRLFGWEWMGGYSRINQDVSTVGATVLPEAAVDHAWNQNFDIKRNFLDGALTVTAGEQGTHDRQVGSLGTNDFNLLGYHASVFYRPTEKLSTSVSYAYQEFENGLVESPDTPGQIFVLPTNTYTALSENTNYKLSNSLTVGGGVSYSSTVVPSTTETLEKTVTPFVSAQLQHKWGSFDVGANGRVGYNMTVSDLGRDANATSWEAGAHVSHGSVQAIRWTAGYQGNHSVLPQIVGQYSDVRKASLTAESDHFDGWRLTAGMDYTQNNALTIGGLFNAGGFGFNAGASREHYGLRFYRTHINGNGSIFPTTLNTGSYIVVLPVSLLVSSPLLDKNTTSTGLTGYYNWRRWLISGSFTREADVFSQTNQLYNNVDIEARYTLGKVTLEAGYTRNLLNVGSGNSLSGTLFNRFHFRITRAFTLF